MKGLMGLVLAGVLAIGVGGCGSSNEAPAPGPQSKATEQVPASVVLASAPAGEKTVDAIKKDAKEGDEVVIHGIVGGRKDPFTAQRATMLVVDKNLPNQCTQEADHCKTPWDYCCEDKGALTAKMATVQVTGADGRPLKADLKGVGGLKEMSEVVVKGKVAKVEAGMLVINATGIHVAK
jgi:hypothetical protein